MSGAREVGWSEKAQSYWVWDGGVGHRLASVGSRIGLLRAQPIPSFYA